MSISTQYGQRSDIFGRADYAKAIQSGQSNQQILNFIRSNPGTLRSWNRPGGAGNSQGQQSLYDEIFSRANAEQQAAFQPQQQAAPVINIPPPPPTVPAPMSIKGNAAGVKRKKSRGEMSGTTSQGTSQFNRSMFISPAPLTNLNV